MNPNLNNPSGIHHHQPSHSVSQLQPSLHYPHLPAAHTHPSQLHLSHQSQQQQHHSDPAPIRELPDHQQQQRTNIEHYKSSANPAYEGYIGSTHDALIVFTGCVRGDFSMVSRRLHERERRSIRSGAVYVFDETRAGIKRWTDGRVWSPSRILNNFLVYREIDQKRPTTTNNANGSSTNPPNPNAGPPTASTSTSTANTTHKHDGDKSKIHQLNPGSSPLSTQAQSSNPQYSRPHSINPTGQSRTETRNPSELTTLDPKPSIPKNENQDQAQSAPGENQSTPAATHRPMNRERERSLVGSLTSTYKFRPDGLVKKTISIAGMHMISYYKLDDVVSGRLRAPTSYAHLVHMEIAGHLLNPGFYRAPPTWGVANGRFWIQEEGPEEPSQVLSTVSSASNNSSSLHGGQRPAALPPPASGSTSSSAPQGIRTTHSATRTNASERIPSTALSRPGSSASSTGSPSVTSPTTSHSFPLLSASNLHNTATTPRSPVINAIGARTNFSRVHNNNNNTSPASGSSHLGRSSTIGGASSGRYEPYSRAARSPPHSAASTNTSTLTDQQASVQYYSPNHTTGGLNGYSTHSFLSESHSTPLVGTDQQSASSRNTRQDPSAHDGRNLESPGQVNYDESGTYRTTSSTSGGGESLYAQYTIADPANNSHRSSSVPPSSYGLPSINRVGASAQPSSPVSSTGTRGIGDYPFSGSSSQPQINRLSSTTANHGGSYGGYLSPAVAEHAFRASGGGSGLAERENNSYGPSHSVNSLANPSGQASPSSGTQSASFLYPVTSTSPSSGYSFSSSARRGSAVGSFTSELGSSNNDPARGGTRGNSQNRNNGGGLQLNENGNSG